MLDLALAVIDRLLGLLRHREESDRKLHDDFLVPLLHDVEALHENYLETFAAYRADVESSAVPLSTAHPVLARIDRDSLFTAQLRAKLLALHELEDDPVFADVVRAVWVYISAGETAKSVLLEGQKPIPNAPRRRLAVGLKTLFSSADPDATKRAEAIRLLDEIVMEQQVSYGRFRTAADRTRRRLLDRRVGK